MEIYKLSFQDTFLDTLTADTVTGMSTLSPKDPGVSGVSMGTVLIGTTCACRFRITNTGICIIQKLSTSFAKRMMQIIHFKGEHTLLNDLHQPLQYIRS